MVRPVEGVHVALSQAEVDDFLATPKTVPAGDRLVWTDRNPSVRMARIGVEARGVRRGVLLLLHHTDHRRHWTFKVLRLSTEVLRWDAQPPPHSHSNPPGRPPGWPRKFRDADHEHAWHPELGTRLARPNAALAAADNHEMAFIAFCERANIDPASCYTPPPPPTEQLAFLT